MCDRRELERVREQRDDAIERAVEIQGRHDRTVVAYKRFAGIYASSEEENVSLRAALVEAVDELAACTALLADLAGE